jgi:excisionase family DNA binding protein
MATTALTPPSAPRERVFVSRAAAAELLSVSERTIERAEKTGELQSFRVGRRVVIRASDQMEFATRKIAHA